MGNELGEVGRGQAGGTQKVRPRSLGFILSALGERLLEPYYYFFLRGGVGLTG